MLYKDILNSRNIVVRDYGEKVRKIALNYFEKGKLYISYQTIKVYDRIFNYIHLRTKS